MKKRLIHQEDIKVLSVYVSTHIISKYIKPKLTQLKGIGKYKNTVREFNTPLLITDRPSRK